MFEKIKINLNKLRISSIIILSLCLFMINSLTIIMRYSVLYRYLFIFGIFAFVLFVSPRLNFKTKEQKIWFSFLVYVTVSAFVFQNKVAMTMLFSLWCFSLLLIVDLDTDFYKRLIGAFNIFIFVFVLSMYLNTIIPNLMTGPLNFLLLDEAKGTISKEVAAHVYSGLFAEKLAAAYGSCIGFVFAYSQYIRCFKVKYLILSLFYIAAIFLSGKRIATVIPIVIMIVSVIISLKDRALFRRARKYLLGVCVLMVIGIAVVPQIREILGRIFAVFFSDTTEDLTSNRTTLLWPIAQLMFSVNPIFGYGLNTYNSFVSDMFSSSNSVLSSWGTNGHNIYLQLTAETGIIGAVLIFSLFFCLLIRSFKLYITIKEPDDKQLCLISIGMQCVFLLVGITENSFYVTGELITYLVAFGIFVALKRKYNV